MRRTGPGKTAAAVLFVALAITVGSRATSFAVSMAKDPKGFRDIAWGSSLAARSDLSVARTGPNVTEYVFKELAPSFADVPVLSVRLSSVDEQFARVTIRYQGEDAHKRIMAYLEREFGPIERIPGQMMRGLNQQYNWRGTDSEINVTYQASTERGFIFIDSRNLAPRFNDNIADSAD